MSARDGESLGKSERSMLENGDVEEGFHFLNDKEGEEKVEDGEGKEDPVATGNGDDDDRQPIPEGKVIWKNIKIAIHKCEETNSCCNKIIL